MPTFGYVDRRYDADLFIYFKTLIDIITTEIWVRVIYLGNFPKDDE